MATPIFLGYDRAALDPEYNNRGKVKNALRLYLPLSGRERTGAGQAADPLRPAIRPAPWRGLDVFPPRGRVRRRCTCSSTAATGTASTRPTSASWFGVPSAGALTVVIDYALIPAVDMDELVRQVRAAVAWVHRNARDLGGDPDRISVAGHSAGGHLVAMLLATDWTRVRGARDVAQGRLRHQRALRPRADPALLPERRPGAHAGDRAPQQPHPPGPDAADAAPPPRRRAEGPEYHRQTDALATAWRARGVPIEVLDMAGHDHFSIITELESPFSPLARAIQGQMRLT